MKKVTLFILLTSSLQLPAITSTMTHRIMSSSPLLYKMIDYSKKQTSYEVEPLFSSMYDSQHTIANLTPFGKQTLTFDQQGNGDVNPAWINLMSNNTQANYNSQVNFTPKLTETGALFHWYNQFGKKFFDIKTALVQCRSEIKIDEIGGGNGLNSGILNAQQAFTQSSWNYGKIGESNQVTGLDNIELKFGAVSTARSNASTYDMFISGFGIIEAPTGTGTKAEWLFEPQVGTNHWGLGFGFESLVSKDDLKFMIAGNYRYLTPAWETRSFDLLGNGSWSRYLSVQDTYGLPTAPVTLGLPGINFLTQQAYINGRSEVNFYSRLQKHFQSCYFELSYNFLCIQKETIGTIKNITPDYGIYALTGSSGGSGGVTTSSSATINQDLTTLDPIGFPVAITTERFNKLSAAAGVYATNTLATRFEVRNNNIVYGFGASIEAAQSASAISSWTVWAKFEYLFNNKSPSNVNMNLSTPLYDLDDNVNIIHHPLTMNDTGLPDDVRSLIEDDFMDNKESFKFLDNEESSLNASEMDALQDDLKALSQDIVNNEINYNIELKTKKLFGPRSIVTNDVMKNQSTPKVYQQKIKPHTTLFTKEDEIDYDNELITGKNKTIGIELLDLIQDQPTSVFITKSDKPPIKKQIITPMRKAEKIVQSTNAKRTQKKRAIINTIKAEPITDHNIELKKPLITESVEPKHISESSIAAKTIDVQSSYIDKEKPTSVEPTEQEKIKATPQVISTAVEGSQADKLQVKVEPIKEVEQIVQNINAKKSPEQPAIINTIKAEPITDHNTELKKPLITENIEPSIASETIDVQSLYIDKEKPTSIEPIEQEKIKNTPQVISTTVEGSQTDKLQGKIEPMKEIEQIVQNVNAKEAPKKEEIVNRIKTESMPHDEVLQFLNQSKESKKTLLQQEKNLKMNEEPNQIKVDQKSITTVSASPTIISSPVQGSQIDSLQGKIEPIKKAEQIVQDANTQKTSTKKSAVDTIKAEPIPHDEDLQFINPGKVNSNNSMSEEDILKKLDSTK